MPRAPLGPLRFLLCLFIPIGVGLLFFLGFGSLKEAPVRDLKSYSGSLTHLRDTASLALPSNIQIKLLFIKEGDSVSKGETIGIIDTVALKETIRSAESSLADKHALKDCFVDLFSEDRQAHKPTTGAMAPMMLPSNNPALSVCEQARGERRNQETNHAEKRNILEQRLHIAKSKQTVLRQFAQKRMSEADLTRAIALRSLENASTITSLQQAISNVDQKAREADILFRQRHTAKIASLAQEIRKQEQQLSILQTRLKKPLLLAPVSGIAHPVTNAYEAKGQPPSERAVVEISEDVPPEFQIHFVISEQDASEIPISSRVNIKPLGAAAHELSLTGEITGYYADTPHASSQTTIRAEVKLSEDSQQRLITAINQRGLPQHNAATKVTVAKAPKPLGEVLAQHPLIGPFREKSSLLQRRFLERFSRVPVEDDHQTQLSAAAPFGKEDVEKRQTARLTADRPDQLTPHADFGR